MKVKDIKMNIAELSNSYYMLDMETNRLITIGIASGVGNKNLRLHKITKELRMGSIRSFDLTILKD